MIYKPYNILKREKKEKHPSKRNRIKINIIIAIHNMRTMCNHDEIHDITSTEVVAKIIQNNIGHFIVEYYRKHK